MLQLGERVNVQLNGQVVRGEIAKLLPKRIRVIIKSFYLGGAFEIKREIVVRRHQIQQLAAYPGA